MNEVTRTSNMIIPEVMGDMIEAKINALAKFIKYAKLDTTLQGVPGDTKTVPSWNYIGDAVDVGEGEEVETSTLTATTTTFTIKKAMKSVAIYQEAINSGLGDPVGQAETQLGKSIVGKVDNDVLDAVYQANSFVGDGSTVIGYAGIVDANTSFEDEEDGTEKVMFIHPKQEATLLKDPNFLSADKFQAGVAIKGSIGKIAGCWIKKSKKVKTNEAMSAIYELLISQPDDWASKYKTYFTKTDEETYTAVTGTQAPTFEVDTYYKKVSDAVPGDTYFINPVIKLEADSSETEYTESELPAITIFLKKDTTVDHEYFPKKQQHDITACKYYGVALTNAAKVVLARFKL